MPSLTQKQEQQEPMLQPRLPITRTSSRAWPLQLVANARNAQSAQKGKIITMIIEVIRLKSRVKENSKRERQRQRKLPTHNRKVRKARPSAEETIIIVEEVVKTVEVMEIVEMTVNAEMAVNVEVAASAEMVVSAEMVASAEATDNKKINLLNLPLITKRRRKAGPSVKNQPLNPQVKEEVVAVAVVANAITRETVLIIMQARKVRLRPLEPVRRHKLTAVINASTMKSKEVTAPSVVAEVAEAVAEVAAVVTVTRTLKTVASNVPVEVVEVAAVVVAKTKSPTPPMVVKKSNAEAVVVVVVEEDTTTTNRLKVVMANKEEVAVVAAVVNVVAAEVNVVAAVTAQGIIRMATMVSSDKEHVAAKLTESNLT